MMRTPDGQGIELDKFHTPNANVDLYGADGGGRTHTSVKILDFESSASANSATSATSPPNIFRPGAK